MFRLIFLLFILLAGFILGPLLVGQQGYVLISVADYQIEMSLVTLVIIFVAILAILYTIEYICRKVIQLHNGLHNWLFNRKVLKIRKRTLKGLEKLNEGNYKEAQKLIGRDAEYSETPLFNLIKAAEAAQKSGNVVKTEEYLQKATAIAGNDNFMLEMAKTEILLAQNKFSLAKDQVDRLLGFEPNNPKVLQLAVEIYSKADAFIELDKVLPRVERANLYSKTELAELVLLVENGLLAEQKDKTPDEFVTWWQQESKQHKNSNYFVLGAIKHLIAIHEYQKAYGIILDNIKRFEFNSSLMDELLTQIIQLNIVDNTKLTKYLTRKYSENKQNILLNRALGYLYARSEKFDQAKQYFNYLLNENSIENIEDCKMAYYVYDRISNKEESASLKQKLLQQNIGLADNLEQEPITEIDKDMLEKSS